MRDSWAVTVVTNSTESMGGAGVPLIIEVVKKMNLPE